MKLAKWGNSLAIRIPAEVVEQLEIAPNEEVEIRVTGENSFEVTRDRRRQDAIEAMRKMAVPVPEGLKFNREGIYDRFELSVLGRSLQESTPESSQESKGAR